MCIHVETEKERYKCPNICVAQGAEGLCSLFQKCHLHKEIIMQRAEETAPKSRLVRVGAPLRREGRVSVVDDGSGSEGSFSEGDVGSLHRMADAVDAELPEYQRPKAMLDFTCLMF